MMTFEQLYQTYFQDVHRFALWLSRDVSEADDLASETFVRAWAQRDRLRTETLKAYLLAIARSAFLEQRRRRQKREPLSEDLADTDPGPHRRTSARVDLRRIQGLIEELPESDRVALVLKTDAALPYTEIGRVLEISEGAARVKVHRARRKLLDLLVKGSRGES